MLKEIALNYFKNGYSCSESIVQACIDSGICPKELLPCATTFSGGMSSGCLCGAVAASQIILGYLFGRNNKFGNEVSAREKARIFVSMFKEKHKFTCCKVLSSGYEGSAKKEHCSSMVATACDILEDLIKVKV